MASYKFKTAGGGQFALKDDDSIRLGPAFRNDKQIITGTTFRPDTAADRDAFVVALQALDYSMRTVEVRLEYDQPGEGVYRVVATRTMTEDELNAWVEEERKLMAKRLGVSESAITVTIVAA